MKKFRVKTLSPACVGTIFARTLIDLMIEGHIVNAGGNYQYITDVGLPTMISIYCTQGKWFDADYIKNMLEKLGFDF